VLRPSAAFLTKLLLACALVALLFAKFDLREIASHLTWDSLVAALTVQPIILFGFGVAAVRLATLVGQRPISVTTPFKAIILCYGVNVVVPGRVSELLKATYLRDHAGVALGSGLAAVFVERIADVLMLGVFALAAAAALVTGFNRMAALMALAALTLLFGLPVIAPWAKRLVDRVPAERIRGFFHRFIEHSVERMTHRTFWGVLALSVLMWLTSLTGIVALFSIVGSIPIGITGALVVFVASTIGGAVPALPGGFGTYEAAVVFSLREYGYDFNEALALALTLHGSQIAIACTLAPLIALRERTGVAALITDALAMVRNRR
jgi:uncharacterized protein (TIRG00374 family)